MPSLGLVIWDSFLGISVNWDSDARDPVTVLKLEWKCDRGKILELIMTKLWCSAYSLSTEFQLTKISMSKSQICSQSFFIFGMDYVILILMTWDSAFEISLSWDLVLKPEWKIDRDKIHELILAKHFWCDLILIDRIPIDQNLNDYTQVTWDSTRLGFSF